MSDDQWLQLLAGHPVESKTWFSRATNGVFSRPSFDAGSKDPELPSFPDSQIQRNFVGSAGVQALEEGLLFYRVLKEQCRKAGRPLSPETKVLDFGCGWGRIFRFFLKDVRAENLLGVDLDPEIIQVCQETIKGARFEVVPARPPTSIPDASFDVIYAYSVFSHLAEEVHLAWVQEFARILRKGGLVLATTQKRSFIEDCNSLVVTENTEWQRALSAAFRPMDEVLARYDEGEFVYSPTGGGGVRDASFYGEAVVSERYVDLNWPASLKKLLFDQHSLPQALIVAQTAEPQT
jgi:SAM-dependent methyltransferase